MYANKFCDAGRVPIFRYFEAWNLYKSTKHVDGNDLKRDAKSQLVLQTVCAVVFAINERLKCNALKGCMKVYNIYILSYYAYHTCNAIFQKKSYSYYF